MTLGSKATASISMAFSLAGSVTTAPIPASTSTSKKLSLNTSAVREKLVPSTMDVSPTALGPREFSLYKGVSNRPLGWKSKRKIKPAMGQAARDANLMRWDGSNRTISEWDALRRDPELWYPGGNCLIHLHGHGESKRGPAFKVPFEDLLNANCRPLIDRFLVQDFDFSPVSDSSSSADAEYWGRPNMKKYELYIPAPLAAERKQAMLHHIATRNLFAWIFKKPMVGPHLGGALVALLHSLNEFRSAGVDNVEDLLEYMDQEGYADMRSQPSHALAILFFAETFQFRDIWIDAYAHCAGMNDALAESSEFKHVSSRSRTLIRQGRMEMDIRLDRCSKSLGNFLEDELSTSNVGLSISARDHLDRFRAFLQAYYVDKFGYYPPSPIHDGIAAFPNHAYERMTTEFQNLYDFLVDENFTSSDTSPEPAQGGICVLQNVEAFDQRYHHPPLIHPLPRLPRASSDSPRLLRPRIGWAGKIDKFKVDERLINLASLAKASNRRHTYLMDCPFVKAYCDFEKYYLFSDFKSDKASKVSIVDARKVCWILIYAMLQTLLSNTSIPDEVRDTQAVPYNLCVHKDGCPPWREENSSTGELDKYINERHQDQDGSSTKGGASSLSSPYPESSETYGAIEPDIDYFQLTRKSSAKSTASSSQSGSKVTRKSTIRRAISTLGNLPELRHPRPVRNSFHEILVHGYGNGLNSVSIGHYSKSAPYLSQGEGNNSSDSVPSISFSDAPLPSTWSGSDGSPLSSVSNLEHHDTDRGENKGSAANKPGNQNNVFTGKTGNNSMLVDGVKLPPLLPPPLSIPENVWVNRLRSS